MPEDMRSLKDISSPHWSSEALVPILNPKTQSVTGFRHATEKSEHSVLGARFLENGQKALVKAANSVIETVSSLDSGWILPAVSRSTAFEVGPGGLESTISR